MEMNEFEQRKIISYTERIKHTIFCRNDWRKETNRKN